MSGKPATQATFVRILAQRLGIAEDEAARVLSVTGEILRDRLRAGERVEIGDLFELSLGGAAELRQDESGGFSAYAPKQRDLRVAPVGALREDLELASSAAVYYVSRSSGHFMELLSDYFGKRGWQLIHKRNAREVPGLFRRHPPAALIVESRAEAWQELVRDLKCDPATNWVPTIGIYPAATSEDPDAGVFVQPDEVIREPFDYADFITRAGLELAARVTAPRNDIFELELQLTGEKRDRRHARQLVEEVLYRSGMPETFGRDVGSAIGETLDNAVRHGHQSVACCAITIRLLLDPKRLVLTVRDTGDGFDHAAALTAARGHRTNSDDPLIRAAEALRTRRGAAREGGLARLLTLVDQIDFNRKGNEVTMIKHR